MNLVIVESPTKARTLSRFLGADFQIEATLGHVRDLPKKKLGIDIENNFKPEYVIVPERRKEVSQLKERAGQAQKIILATDPDREGEAIAWHVAHLLQKTEDRRQKTDSRRTEETAKTESVFPSSVQSAIRPPSSVFRPLERIVFHEITEQAVKDALSHPREIDARLVDAQQARRVLDRLVGYKLSPLLWRKIRRGLSAGRVQSVAVRLIVEREREIEAFKPEEYWKIEAELQKTEDRRQKTVTSKTDDSKNTVLLSSENRSTVSPSYRPLEGNFLAQLVEKDGEKIKVENKTQADEIVAELEKASYKVKNIDTQEVRKYPFPPFTTSTMQQAAVILFGWSSKRTMQVAQNLYEQGLITYHRTDSVNLAKPAIFATRNFIEKEYGKNYLPDAPRIYKTKSKVAQEAHEAIRVTKIEVRSEKLEVGRDEKKLYDLIWKRFVACQMKEAIFEETKIDIEARNDQSQHAAACQVLSFYLFRATGSKLMFDGWKRIYSEDRRQKTEDSNQKTEDGETENKLPPLEIGELLKLIKLLPSQHFTEPPPRYTEATLIKALEEKGIGRPSTYAPIISTIQERQYVEKIEKKFAPTVLGITVNDFLVDNFFDVVDVGFTAKMEDNLDSIARGENQWVPVVAQFYGPFSETLDKVGEEAERVKVPVEETDEKCEKCGAAMVVRIGRFGKFLACSKFPDCKFTKPYLLKTGLTCPNCGGEVVIKKTRRGKSFYGCSNYPTCKFAAWRRDQIKLKMT